MAIELESDIQIFNEISTLLLPHWREYTEKSIGTLQNKLLLSYTDASDLLSYVTGAAMSFELLAGSLRQTVRLSPCLEELQKSNENFISSTAPSTSSKSKRKTSRSSKRAVSPTTKE